MMTGSDSICQINRDRCGVCLEGTIKADQDEGEVLIWMKMPKRTTKPNKALTKEDRAQSARTEFDPADCRHPQLAIEGFVDPWQLKIEGAGKKKKIGILSPLTAIV